MATGTQIIAPTSLQRSTVTGSSREASFSISDFVANVGKIVRPNLFKVKITSLPSVMTNVGTALADLEEFQFRCERAELPGRSIATIDEITSSGPTIKMPYDNTYNDMQLTIICSEDMFERTLFELWMNNIVTESGTYGGLVRYYDEFAHGSQIEITQLNESADWIAIYTLHDAFPIQLSPMNLAWEENNTYQRFTVTFAYRYHKFKTPTNDNT